MWMSLIWTNWNGVRPLDVNFLGNLGAGFGKVTLKGVGGSRGQRPKRAVQRPSAVVPFGDISRKSWARMGPWMFSSARSCTRPRLLTRSKMRLRLKAVMERDWVLRDGSCIAGRRGLTTLSSTLFSVSYLAKVSPGKSPV